MENAEGDTDKVFGRLLENEYLLEKVLAHVVADGLHECRRVCRKWRKVCGRLPVRLAVTPEMLKELYELNLEDVCGLFPNATSVSIWIYSEEECAETEQLAGLRHLRRLQWIVNKGLRTSESCFARVLQAFGCLQLLTLELSDFDSLADLYSSLRFLTKLTALKIFTKECTCTPLDMERITELRNIKSLRLEDAPFINAAGQFLFQPSAGFTSLSFKSTTVDENSQRILEIIHPYIKGVRTLRLQFGGYSIVDLSGLTTLTDLRSLTLEGVACATLQEKLRRLHRLKELHLLRIAVYSQQVWNSILSLTRLTSLAYCSEQEDDQRLALHTFSRLAQLKNLSVIALAPGTSLSHLTGLVRLNIFLQQVPCPDVWEALVHLTNLEGLQPSADYECRLDIKSAAFAQLKKLRELKLGHMSVDCDFIPTLANLPKLTLLDFDGHKGHGHIPSINSQLSLLSNLRQLCLLVESQDLNASLLAYFPEGSFPRLRTLQLWNAHMTDSDEREMFRRLPSLNWFLPRRCIGDF